MALTDVKVRNAKPKSNDYKLSDSRGLFILVTKAGSKLWRLKFRLHGKERKMSLGKYPEVCLKEARMRAASARRMVDENIDPVAQRREEKMKSAYNAENSFSLVALEYIEKLEREGKAEATISKAGWLLNKLEEPLGRRPVSEIEPVELRVVLDKLCDSGKYETAGRVRAFASRVFRYAASTARAKVDPALILKGSIPKAVVKHHAAITTKEDFGRLLRAIEDYSGSPVTRAALRLSAILFQRPGEIRQMEWEELNLERRIWTIPAAKMKGRSDHRVPLPPTAVAILTDMHGLTGEGRYVLPSPRSWRNPMSENAVTTALRRMGFGAAEMTAHGFRTSASTMLNESGLWHPDAIERALAHKDRDQIRGSYNRGDYWDERVKMADWWNDQITLMRDGADILLFNQKRLGS